MLRCIAVVALLLAVPSVCLAQPAPDKKSEDRLDAGIKKALSFLAQSQNTDGTWSAGGRGKHPAISALAVMAFLSAGHVPGEGRYGPVVEKGIRAVMKMQSANGLFASDGGHEMYHHGICTLMLAEVVGMTQGPLAQEVRKNLEKALVILLTAQRKGTGSGDVYRGGWRYRVAGTDADMSVTGWQMMALRAAKNVGCDIPPEVIDRAVDYVKRSQNPYNGAFRYTPHGGETVACTGTGILALSVCSSKRPRDVSEAVKGGNFLLKSPPTWGGPHFFYSIYYCSQAMFQLGDPEKKDADRANTNRTDYWSSFRKRLHDLLLNNQNQTTGSWYGSDGYGPSYSTAMGVLALTVEYRYLPIYQRHEEASDKK